MAGIPSHTRSSSSKRLTGSAGEKAKCAQSGQSKQAGSSSSNQQREQPFETPTVQLSSPNSNSDFLFITTNKPANFKDPGVRKEISRHVMKHYASQQSGKEPSRGKNKESTKARGDKETGVSSPNVSLPNPPARESIVRSTLKVLPLETKREQNYISGGSTMFTPRTLHSSALTQDMIYPLNIDLSSLDFQQRLGHLLSRYMSVCRFHPPRLSYRLKFITCSELNYTLRSQVSNLNLILLTQRLMHDTFFRVWSASRSALWRRNSRRMGTMDAR